MQLKVRYATTERHWVTQMSFQYLSKDAVLEPVRIVRSRCGSYGAATLRYYYYADVQAPEDAVFVQSDGTIRCNISRKDNPKFDPKKLTWVGNVATISEA